MRYVSVVFAVLVLVGVSFLLSPSTNTAAVAVLDAQDNPVAMSEESVAGGRRIYARFCRSCHGPDGQGDGAGAPEGAIPANLVDGECDTGCGDAEVFTAIKDGVAPDYFMEPWEGRITDEDIWNTVNYLKDLASRQ